MKNVQLFCHRTANEDLPENTMESLEQAVLLGCDMVEIDIRRTLDGELVLDHDGILEHLTDGTGTVEGRYYGELARMDAGSWMGERFAGLRITHFRDALLYARDHGIRLHLDMKTPGMAAQILQLLRQENMLEQVTFGGESDGVKQLYPAAMGEGGDMVWLQPGDLLKQIQELHAQGKKVVVNFSAGEHDMDLQAMKRAVADGADAINVDYPRLGADAAGKPVERTIGELKRSSFSGDADDRARAILQLGRYRGFNLQATFVHCLDDPDERVSRAAALALLDARPHTSPSVFAEALSSRQPAVRATAAWALGTLRQPAEVLLPLLHDSDSKVLTAALIAMSHMPGRVPSKPLLALLQNRDLAVRGAAALALAQQQPDAALHAVPPALDEEMRQVSVLWKDYVQRGKPKLTDDETRRITDFYRSQQQMVRAIAMLKTAEATPLLEKQAFRPGEDFSWGNATTAAFQLWDRIAASPQAAIQALGAEDSQVADRAEWALVKAGPAVLPAVREALHNTIPQIRRRAIEVAAWQADTNSVSVLQDMRRTATGPEAVLLDWAVSKMKDGQ
ncbi:MAG TPA: HEAT repeat domain-containing protein [Acidobacteriaceae bacterium]|nr:HEAT repeat domain-containing protein [Acidobacteriaceae bacterium]